MIKIKRYVLFIVLLVFLILPLIASAEANPLTNLGQATPDELRTRGELTQIIATAVNVVLGMVGVIFLILMIYGGFVWATAGGDASKIEKAKGIIRAAVIGILITLGAYAITVLILTGIGIGE